VNTAKRGWKRQKWGMITAEMGAIRKASGISRLLGAAKLQSTRAPMTDATPLNAANLFEGQTMFGSPQAIIL